MSVLWSAKPTPAPPSPPAPQQVVHTHKLAASAWLPWVLVAVMVVGFMGYLFWLERTSAKPGPDDALARATRVYLTDWPSTLEGVAEQVRSGRLTTKAEVQKALAAHARPFEAALDDAFRPHINGDDPKGTITNASALADAIHRAAEAVK